MTKGREHKKVWKTVTAITGVAVLLAVIYVMTHGLGLQDGLDFGAGAYYYADIPEFDKYLNWDTYKAGLPYWVYALLFIAWGVLMYALWKWIDRKK